LRGIEIARQEIKERYRRKRIEKAFEKLENCAIIVEGKKDRDAFASLGFDNVYTIAEIGAACEKIRQAGYTKAVILTDRDRAGDVKCRQVAGKLQSCGIAADAETRRQLSGLLVLRNFQDIAYRLEKQNERKKRKNGEKYGKDIH
jgi:5S rRNA maturation endonuclease (ribonuclease M5)